MASAFCETFPSDWLNDLLDFDWSDWLDLLAFDWLNDFVVLRDLDSFESGTGVKLFDVGEKADVGCGVEQRDPDIPLIGARSRAFSIVASLASTLRLQDKERLCQSGLHPLKPAPDGVHNSLKPAPDGVHNSRQ
jgi:hypothetical protein